MASLGAGFAAAVGAALAMAARRRMTQVLALLWAPAVMLAVVATGNHFVTDIVAGLVVTALGALLTSAQVRRLALRALDNARDLDSGRDLELLEQMPDMRLDGLRA